MFLCIELPDGSYLVEKPNGDIDALNHEEFHKRYEIGERLETWLAWIRDGLPYALKHREGACVATIKRPVSRCCGAAISISWFSPLADRGYTCSSCGGPWEPDL